MESQDESHSTGTDLTTDTQSTPTLAGRLALFLTISVTGLIADLWSKSYMFTELGLPDATIGVVLASDGSGYWLARSESPRIPIVREDSEEPYRVTFGEGRASFAAGVSARVERLQDGMLLFDALGGLANPAADPAYLLSCNEEHVRMTVRAGTGFVRIHR